MEGIMNSIIKEVAIQSPKSKFLLTNHDVLFGQSIDPLKRMDIFSPDEFEMFIELWVTESLQGEYNKIVRCGGAGDMGRDVIAYFGGSNSAKKSWDNYQCKHYSAPLTPSNIWVEIGKLCYYTYAKEYTIPNQYFFVCQKGVGNKLNKLLENPVKLKEEFINCWNSHCKDNITKTSSVPLTNNLLAHITSIDFSIFSHKTPLELVKSFEESLSFASFFGGGLRKRREMHTPPPLAIQPTESTYTKKLFKAYEDYLQGEQIDEERLAAYPKLKKHFDRQRLYYYTAETLLDLERDTRPKNDDYVNSLKDEIFNNIIDTVDSDFPNGFERVKAVTDRARLISLDAHPLTSFANADDRHGVCHHLSNEGRIDWMNKDE